jgi:ribosomal peptide maturation radical SAM protein 1
MLDVLLVSMPFATQMSPSIGLSLLKAGLTARGFSSSIRYFTIMFAEMTGDETYWPIVANEGGLTGRELAGEWVFAEALAGSDPGSDDQYVRRVLLERAAESNPADRLPVSESCIAHIVRARAMVDEFLEACLEEVGRVAPKIMGFTCVFQQHVASLALARRVKERYPETMIVLGGANCEGVMGAETIRAYPFVDFCVSGEADLLFPEFVMKVLSNESVEGLPGVRSRATVDREFEHGFFSNAPMVFDMDALARPDYSEFFDQFEKSAFGEEWQPTLHFESSRGCWWGEKQHCTFCGLNGQSMQYRSKSGPRAFEELTELIEAHPGCDIQVTDLILDMNYFKDFLPRLAEYSHDVTLLYETKSNLKKDHLRLLYDAGVRIIQPGIENLSDSVLRLMRKGVTGLQNIQLLKWCGEIGVDARWNFLWGFAREDAAEYAKMAGWIQSLVHLRPPDAALTLRLDRFSPNFFDAHALGYSNVRPLLSYSYIYRGLDLEAISNLAYFFDFDYREPQHVEMYVKTLIEEIEHWKLVHAASQFYFEDLGDLLSFFDTRPTATARVSVLEGVEREICLAAESVTSHANLMRAVDASPELVEKHVSDLVKRRYLISDGDRVLALAVRVGSHDSLDRVRYELKRATVPRSCAEAPR